MVHHVYAYILYVHVETALSRKLLAYMYLAPFSCTCIQLPSVCAVLVTNLDRSLEM